MELIIYDFDCEIEKGKLRLYDKTTFNKIISGLPNCEGVLEFRAVGTKKKRTTRQNKYYWGVIIKHFQRLFYNASGDEDFLFDKEITHEQLKNRLLTRDINGEKYVKSSKKLNTLEWEAYCNRCRDYAMTIFNHYIPLPKECNL